jgi:hypothetical protein
MIGSILQQPMQHHTEQQPRETGLMRPTRADKVAH